MSKQTHQQILEKAIAKAIDDGYRLVYPYTEPMHDGINDARNRVFFGDCTEATALIFNHDFAEALWGKEQWRLYLGPPVKPFYADKSEGWVVGMRYQLHLMRMAKAKDPIAYLGENI